MKKRNNLLIWFIVGMCIFSFISGALLSNYFTIKKCVKDTFKFWTIGRDETIGSLPVCYEGSKYYGMQIQMVCSYICNGEEWLKLEGYQGLGVDKT